MALRQPTPQPDDPRLRDHVTTHQPSRGGWYPAPPKPVLGTPKEQKTR